ncbi:MAG: type II toxin-antitoxin system RelE family toxin [Candidatus Brocadiales bacterium]
MYQVTFLPDAEESFKELDKPVQLRKTTDEIISDYPELEKAVIIFSNLSPEKMSPSAIKDDITPFVFSLTRYFPSCG